MTPSSLTLKHDSSIYNKEHEVKWCSKCRLLQPLDKFGKNSNRPDGLAFWCKTCSRESNKKLRDKNTKARFSPSFEEPKSQFCTKCKNKKDISCFYRCAAKRGGYRNQCKDCVNFIISDPYAIGGNRICEKCKKEKSVLCFSKTVTGPFGLHRWCKTCTVRNSKRWKKNHPERVRKTSSRRVFGYYGITQEWYDRKLAEQGGGCAICGVEQSGVEGKRFHIDHNHNCCKDGKACNKCRRGILCMRCNTWIERFERVPDMATKALVYLQKYKGVE